MVYQKQRVHLVLILSTASILVIIAIYFLLYFKESRGNEMLIAWGLREASGHCLLWLIDPEIQLSNEIMTDNDDCNYMVAMIEGQLQLIHIQTFPGEITIYHVTSERQLIERDTIAINKVGIASPPQWGIEGKIYSSGFLNGRTQIYTIDAQTGVVTPFVTYEKGIAVDPSISPHGKYLAYWTLDGLSSQSECRLSCIFGNYHVLNLETQATVNLFSMIEPLLERVQSPDLLQCNLSWSPSGQFLAFHIGSCSGGSPRNLAIIDIENNQVVTLLKPISEEGRYYDPSFIGWLSDKELIYEQSLFFPEHNRFATRYRVYSIDTQTSRELAGFLPVVNNENIAFELRQIDWTSDGNDIVGIVLVEDTLADSTLSLAKINIAGENTQIDYFESPHKYNLHPLWSPDGKWIAYYSATGRNEADMNGVNVRIVDKTGTIDFTSGATNIIELHLHYAWLEFYD